MTSSRLADLMGPHRRPWSVGLAALAFSAVAVLATACGGGGSGGSGSANAVAHLGATTTTTSATTSGAGAAAGAGAGASGSSAAPAGGGPNPEKIGADLMKFSACMRSHGVPNFPNPVISNNSVSLQITPAVSKGSPQFQHASQSCQKYAPPRPTAVNLTTAQEADYLKAAQCMRAHGINGFPDPDFSGGRVQFPLPQGMNANTTQFEAARHICQNLIPDGLPYSSTDENP
jgi:hypothetical protein